MSVHSAIFTALKDSLKLGVVDKERLIESLSCSPDDSQIVTLVDNLLSTVDTLASACEENSIPHPVTHRKRKFT